MFYIPPVYQRQCSGNGLMNVMLFDENLVKAVSDLQQHISAEEEYSIVVTDRSDVALNPDTKCKLPLYNSV